MKWSVPKQTIISIFTEVVCDVSLPMLKKTNEQLYKDLGFLAQNKSRELQLAIGGAASGAELIVDALPFLREDVHAIIDEALESVANGVIKHFRGKDLGLANDYQPRASNVGELVIEVFRDLANVLKGSTEKVARILAKIVPGASSGRTQFEHQHLEALAVRNPDLLGAWMAFIAKLPPDAESDLRGSDKSLCIPGVIESLLNLSDEERENVIKRLSKRTFGQMIANIVEGFCDAVDPILEDSKKLRERLDRERAERRAARRAREGNGT